MTSEINDYCTPLGIDTLKLAEYLGYTKGTMLRLLLRAGNHETITELEDLKTVRGLLDLRIGELEAGEKVDGVRDFEFDASKIFVKEHELTYSDLVGVVDHKVVVLNTRTLEWDVAAVRRGRGSNYYSFIEVPGESVETAEYLIVSEDSDEALPLSEIIKKWKSVD